MNDVQIVPDRYVEIITAAALCTLGAPITQTASPGNECVKDQLNQPISCRARSRHHSPLVAFFACLYFAMLRPSEAIALRADDCHLPQSGWGHLELHQATPIVRRQWTDTGAGHEQRGLKNRPRRAVHVIPIPPELVAILRCVTPELETLG